MPCLRKPKAPRTRPPTCKPATSRITALPSSWTKSAGATSYEYGGRNEECNFGWYDIGDVNSHTFVCLASNTPFQLQVRAKNAHGVSSAATLTITTLIPPGPPEPTNLQASNITHNRVTLSWDKSAGATSYEVAYSVNGIFILDYTDVGDVASYTFTGLKPNTQHNISVRAINSQGPSRIVFLFIDTLPAPASSRSSSKSEPTPLPTATPTPKPPVYTLNQLPPSIQVSNWVEGAQGRRVGSDAISRVDLIQEGILDAVDVYGYVTPGVEVCFKRQGRAVFLDASFAPRRLSDLPSYQRADMTCVNIDRAGAVVLLHSGSPPPPQANQAEQPPSQQIQPQQSQPLSPAMSDCEVQPYANLKFRQSPPDGLVLGVTGSRDWLPASDKRAGYFKVRLWGVEGWISGAYVHIRGDCGA